MEKFTLEEILFAIGHFPSANSTDKFTLYVEYMEKYFPGILSDQPYITTQNLKKLSSDKKASFMSYLEDLDIKETMQIYRQNGISWTTILSDDYPVQLKHIFTPPVVLYYKGNIQLLSNRTMLGVVGSRDFTPYGQKAVDKIIPRLIKQTNGEIAIVSGLAKGIDTEAHLAAIKHLGHTIGVIGTGLDVYYPVKNKMLQDLMSKEALVVTEYPMGSQPLKYRFPERNRIIAGLSRGVLVIEAKKRSGSLITAYNAIEEGRDVFAVPGSILEPHREGNHKLIQLGAVLVQSSEDILSEWAII